MRADRTTLRAQAGHALLEWLVAAALGLVALAGALTVYRSHQAAFSRAAEAAKMREAASAALTLVGQHLQMAGYAPVDEPALRARVTPGLFGCERARPLVGGTDDEIGCAMHPDGPWGVPHEAGRMESDSVVVRYVDDGVATWQSASGEPTDCLGQAVARHGRHAVVVNRFYVARAPKREAPELYCGGNGHAITPQPLVEGVERMRLRYWLRGVSEPVGARAVSAGQWRNVVAVELCVVVRGRRAGARGAWVDCDGKHAVGADGRERLSLSRQVALRNAEPAN